MVASQRLIHRAAILVGLVALVSLTAGCGDPGDAGVIEGERLPQATVSERSERRAEAAAGLAAEARLPEPEKQVLFGDLHVHSTFSADAFMMSLPILSGEGAHPVADACDFARYCSGLDFWSINDHAESITSRRWRETKESIRQCNALSGDGPPDVAAFLGWEWTQVGTSPENHWGHKNVILRDLAEDRVPTRPIDSDSFTTGAMRQAPTWDQRLLPILDFRNRGRYFDFYAFQNEVRGTERCEVGVDVRELPEDCMEGAATPEILFEKLDQWGFESMVIPHGTTWGIYTPPGSSWDKQLTPAQHDPEQQRLIEVFSGHGNSEEYRTYRSVEFDASGAAHCPAPTGNFEACCWRAGEIVRDRCEEPGSACEERAAEARQNFVAAGVAGRLTLPGVPLEEWKDCGECRDCFVPSMKYRAGGAAQYILGLSGFAGPGEPERFQFGFIASSDNHTARPGTGYKEFARSTHTEARGPVSATWEARINRPISKLAPVGESVPVDLADPGVPPYLSVDFERQASYFLTGGLAVVHASGRSRDAVWDALERREVYGTSGERILLWFDLLNADGGPLPMGQQAKLDEPPRFRVRAAGSFEQEPGCPEVSLQGLSPERLEYLCRGECYNPGDTRHVIDRIEVVRIRPQMQPSEDVGTLIEDPWRSLPCPPDPAGCVVEFEDPEFAGSSRPHTYYVRAIQPPTPIVNGGLARCEYDDAGNCLEANPCQGGYHTAADDDCLTLGEERAWSSPIYVYPR